MNVKRDPSKLLQIGFTALILTSLALAAFWVLEQNAHTNLTRDRLTVLYRNDARAVSVMLRDAEATNFDEILPHLDIDYGARTASVDPEALAAIEGEARGRNNRFLWEGGFFIAVLLGGLIVLTRTIRHDAELRRRQQNFLAAVSHEFKSPLASIRLAAETLVMRSAESESRRIGERILEDNERLLRMTDNLLDTTRIEEGRIAFAPEHISLAPMATAAVESVRERAAHAGIEIGVDVDEALAVSMDRASLESILRNLLDNAVNACLAGDGRRIDVTAVQGGGRIGLSVKDDGAGFPPDEAEMIFEKFYRAGDELRRTTRGTGLGLYIVRRLAAAGGAEIRATSEGPGRGACFTLTWPAAS